MTSLERCMAVLAGGIPDRVPTQLHDSIMAAEAAGYPYARCVVDGERLAAAHLLSWRCFKHDMVVVEADGLSLARAMGCEVGEGGGGLTPVLRPAIEATGEVVRLHVPDPEKSAPLREVLRAVGMLHRELGDRVFLVGCAGPGPAALAATLLGYERFLAELGESGDHSRLDSLLDLCLDALVRFAAALQRAGARAASICELGPQLVSPARYGRFVLPRLRRFCGVTRSAGLAAVLHTCGDAGGVLSDLAATGAAVLDLDQHKDLREVKEAMRGRTVIAGGIDAAGVMQRGTDALVEARCREAIEILGPYGGFIVGPGAVLSPDTPPENVAALIETVRKYGCYRPDGQLAR